MTRGGPRKAGPGKKMGRPKVENPRVPFNTRIRVDLVEWLKTRKNQAETVEKALDIYIELKEEDRL